MGTGIWQYRDSMSAMTNNIGLPVRIMSRGPYKWMQVLCIPAWLPVIWIVSLEQFLLTRLFMKAQFLPLPRRRIPMCFPAFFGRFV